LRVSTEDPHPIIQIINRDKQHVRLLYRFLRETLWTEERASETAGREENVF
jgi:hypothetical protein